MRTVLLASLLAAPAAFADEPTECPAGTTRILTQDPYQPFRCVKEEPKKGFGAVAGTKGFKFRPKCPHGTRPVASTDGLQQYKCVRAGAGEQEPDLAPLRADEDAPALEGPAVDDDPMTRGCPPGKRKVRTADPLRPFQCVTQASRVARLSEESYRGYTIAGEMIFDYPKMFQPRDGWKEDVPTVSFTLDDGSPGKPAMITITKVLPNQPTFVELDTAIMKDKDWQGAQDGGNVIVAGIRSRITFVAGDSKTAYVPLPQGAYYSIVYSAPVESYETYLSAFNRLLKSLRLKRSGR